MSTASKPNQPLGSTQKRAASTCSAAVIHISNNPCEITIPARQRASSIHCQVDILSKKKTDMLLQLPSHSCRSPPAIEEFNDDRTTISFSIYSGAKAAISQCRSRLCQRPEVSPDSFAASSHILWSTGGIVSLSKSETVSL
jgi:hypothetical protein